MQKKIRVGLLFGGRSGEHEVSIASALSIYKALNKTRYEVSLIAIDKEGRWLLPNSHRLLEQADRPLEIELKSQDSSYGVAPYPSKKQMVSLHDRAESTTVQVPHVDVILPILHGTYGEDGTVQGLLELAQIPYAGSGVLGSALGMDKELSRKLLSHAGINTVPTRTVRKSDYANAPEQIETLLLKEFSFPFFVKPANAGSSVGVHKVKSAATLRAALGDAFSFDVKVLVEMGVDARELEVAVLGNENPKASIIGEIIPHHEFYSYEAKYLDENGASLAIPARDLSSALSEKIRAIAVQTFQILDCRGMARVDFFLDRQSGELYLNEINTIPGFTKISMYPKLWEASGLGYSELLDEIIRLAFANYEQRHALKTTRD